jgi:hypothetical protein
VNTEIERGGSASSRHIKRMLLGNVCVLALGLAMAMNSSAAAAKNIIKHKPVRQRPESASKLPFGDMPKGPLEIFVSINQQRLHFYSDGLLVAEVPVATGVPGHLTPLGVFSVIERDRYHHSNIYDNAPMPFMERITWSGVALHQGPGVGRQASHGCIRMPADFAARLWQLPTMGMRVIIAGPELRPLAFADSRLFVHKEKTSTPTSALPPAVETAQKVDPGTKTDIIDPPAVAPINPSTTKVANAEPTHQDDGAMPAKRALPAAKPVENAEKNAEPTLAEIIKGAAAEATQPSKPAEPATAEPTKTAATADPTPSSAAAPAQSATPKVTQSTPAAASASEPATPGAPTQPVPGAAIPAEAASAAPAPADIAAPISLDDLPLPLAKPAQIAKGSSGPIAIFVSRKEGKIYVRQNLAPLFEAPVKIEHPEEPLGTHVFTALDYLPDHSSFRWTVTTLPAASAKAAEQWKYVKDGRGGRKRVRVIEQAAEAPPPVPPQEALGRIEIPQEAIDQISQLIVPGSSLIVSDQGLGQETGEGTDFIVVTR